MIWRKSTFSDTNNCVEVAWPSLSAAVRDSKNPAGPTLTFTRPALAAFVTTLKTPGGTLAE
jgi:hypothetical protein